MKTQNHNISAKEIEGAMNALKTLRDEMKFLNALTPKERQAAPRITPARLALMEIALQGARDNPGTLLAGIDLASYENDVRASRGLYDLLNKLQELCRDVQDTLCTVGKEADAITQQVKVISRTVAKTKPTPGLEALAERLNPRSGRTIKEAAPPAAPAVTGASAPVSAPGPSAGPPPEIKAA
jgi:hypothetical protein